MREYISHSAVGSGGLPDPNLRRSDAQCDRTELGVGLTEAGCLVLSESWMPSLLSLTSANTTLAPLPHTQCSLCPERKREEEGQVRQPAGPKEEQEGAGV